MNLTLTRVEKSAGVSRRAGGQKLTRDSVRAGSVIPILILILVRTRIRFRTSTVQVLKNDENEFERELDGEAEKDDLLKVARVYRYSLD